MGFLMFLGMIGSIAYGGHMIKNETLSYKTKNAIKPQYTKDKQSNKDKIDQNFTLILKRCRIKYDKSTGNPTEQHTATAIAYLKKQGYQENDIKYFEELFKEKYQQQQDKEKQEIQDRHQNMLNKIKNSKLQYYTFTINNYSNINTEKKMKKLMQNQLWNKMVDNYTHIRKGNIDEEIWNLYVPKDYAHHKLIREIYLEVCRTERINVIG